MPLMTTKRLRIQPKPDLFDKISTLRVIPVVSLPNIEQAVPLAESLLAGGLPCAEITFRTESAAPAILELTKRFPELLVGAGTVLSTSDADRAIDAGAQFIVAPGSNPHVIDHCISRQVTIFPGVMTPTEVELVLSHGMNIMKFFPAEAAGGTKLLKALTAPYRSVHFIPTGGIDATNLLDYLAIPAVLACGGSWMVKPEWLTNGEFNKVRDVAREAVQLAATKT